MTLSSERAEHRIKLTLHYDGAGFMGWQVQPGARTVQLEVESALTRLMDQPITVIAAGRTDRGVHATGQVASTLVPVKWTAAALQRALNAILPDDIWVASAHEVPLDFHARYSAIARSYFYRIGTKPEAWSPFQRGWCWPLRAELDLALLEQAAGLLVGTHSFAGFRKVGQPERGVLCAVRLSQWRVWACGVMYEVTANRFLHHMVRYMVGTMVDVARGRRPLSDMAGLLRNEAELETSPPAPAQGLFLSAVHYPPEQNGREESGA